MLAKRRFHHSRIEGSNWRSYQTDLKRTEKISARKKIIRKYLKFYPLVIAFFFPAYGLMTGYFVSLFPHRNEAPKIAEDNPPVQQPDTSIFFEKNDIHHFIDSRHISNLDGNFFEIQNNGDRLVIQTTIDISLQNYLTEKLDRKNSSKIGIVVMNPENGRILASVGYDKPDPLKNPCIDNAFPAASLFKIVTAAAAIETCSLNPDSELTFNGRKHTLYKFQLTEKTTKYTNNISLRDAFAKSVNPVFGKLGALYLGKEKLESYAKAFGFYRIINFEIFLPPSLTVLSDEPYQIAEIACGFNKRTRITPVHGALMAAAILNQGRLIEPTIVDRITDEKGVELYRSRPAVIDQAFSPKTSNVLRELMQATIRSGTARRDFRRYQKDKILSRLEIGGKTGTINNRTDDLKYDWFVGYAEEKGGEGKIVLSVLVAHQKYIGTRAAQYATMAFKKYFKDHFTPPNEASSQDSTL